MRVLLVEDDPITQQSIQMMLESEGMVVDTADPVSYTHLRAHET